MTMLVMKKNCFQFGRSEGNTKIYHGCNLSTVGTIKFMLFPNHHCSTLHHQETCMTIPARGKVGLGHVLSRQFLNFHNNNPELCILHHRMGGH